MLRRLRQCRLMLFTECNVEVGDPVDAEHHGVAIEHKLPMSVLQRGLDDPGIPIGPVVTASGNQARAVTVAL